MVVNGIDNINLLAQRNCLSLYFGLMFRRKVKEVYLMISLKQDTVEFLQINVAVPQVLC